MVKRYAIGFLVTCSLFVLANEFSYYARSTGPGFPDRREGVGFPFEFLGEGRIGVYATFDVPALIANLFIMTIAGITVGCFYSIFSCTNVLGAMPEYRVPEPKPVFIIVLTLSGVFGGVLNWGMSLLLSNANIPDLILAVGGGIAFGAALTAAISRSLWPRIVFSPLLSLFGPCVVLAIWALAQEGVHPRTNLILQITLTLMLGGMLSAIFAILHDVFVRRHAKKYSNLLMYPAYVIIGALGGQLLWLGWLTGAIFGFAQFLGMLAALAVDKKMRHAAAA